MSRVDYYTGKLSSDANTLKTVENLVNSCQLFLMCDAAGSVIICFIASSIFILYSNESRSECSDDNISDTDSSSVCDRVNDIAASTCGGDFNNENTDK